MREPSREGVVFFYSVVERERLMEDCVYIDRLEEQQQRLKKESGGIERDTLGIVWKPNKLCWS